MTKLMLGTVAFSLMACATKEHVSAPMPPAADFVAFEGRPVMQAPKGSGRTPAMHAYGSYSCKSAKYDLIYDGPGSNYAVGGFSHLGLRQPKNPKVRALSYELDSEADPKYETKLGETVSDEKLELQFKSVSGTQSTKPIKDIHVGDKCTPGEPDFQHSEWKSTRIIQVIDLLPATARKMNLKKDSQLHFVCEESSDIPVRCPESGRYTAAELP